MSLHQCPCFVVRHCNSPKIIPDNFYFWSILSTQQQMIIAVAGPYSAPTEEQRQRNQDVLNQAAAQLLQRGHIPLIGVNAALPVVAQAQDADNYKAIMDISMAVIAHCDAILLIAESPGANRERDYLAAQGKPVYYAVDEVPDAE